MIAIRGAVTACSDTEEDIRDAVEELMRKLFQENEIDSEEVVSIIFSSTKDITAIYPARAFREMGYPSLPLFSCQEPTIEDSMELCIRVLVHVDRENSEKIKADHIYIRKASSLRPDLN